MSKRSARFSILKDHHPKAEWEQTNRIHNAELEHQKEAMKNLGLSK